MCFARCKRKATDTHSEYVIVIAFPQQTWLRESASLLRSLYNTLQVFLVIIISGSAAQRGLWPPRYTTFLDHTQGRATVGRTPLDE
jgi:hypothetical protein